jgi:predicted O-linked N-acetylglucosamine transferase (SPINDLY family)
MKSLLINLYLNKKYTEAIKLSETLISDNPNHLIAIKVLGSSLKAIGQVHKAINIQIQATIIAPNDFEVNFNLANTYREIEDFNQAIKYYRKSLEIDDRNYICLNNLGLAYKNNNNFDLAVKTFKKSILLNKKYSDPLYNLGNLYSEVGNIVEAESYYKKCINIDPKHYKSLFNLALLKQNNGSLNEAEIYFNKCLNVNPKYPPGLASLGKLYLTLKKPIKAIKFISRAVEYNKNNGVIYGMLAGSYNYLGFFDEAILNYKKAVDLNPTDPNIHSNLLFCLDYHPDLSAEQRFNEYKLFDAKFGAPLKSAWRPHANTRVANRRLRVGYVSPDFRFHVCHLYVEPLFAHHDKSEVELFAYAELHSEDDPVTARYKTYVDHWIPTKGMSDEQLALRIRDDQIDILVDLAGHTGNNRLGAFALKPSPVSVTWLIGSGTTTGSSAIDYALADEVLIPVGGELIYSEAPWRLAAPSYCYRPNLEMGEVQPLPVKQRGHITFGSATRLVRINYRVIKAWAQILKAAPNSRMVIDNSNFVEEGVKELLVSRFEEHGIDKSRLDIGFISEAPWEMLSKIDICLDCFPNNMSTSLLVSLNMGVPYITLSGQSSLENYGRSNLLAVGLPELVAKTEQEYIDKAVQLSQDIDRLEMYRSTLRSKLACSPLRDERGFAKKIENAFRGMWLAFCKTDG